MPLADFWVQALLSSSSSNASTNPSPVPSTTSSLCSYDENYQPTNLLWNPAMMQQLLAFYQMQAHAQAQIQIQAQLQTQIQNRVQAQAQAQAQTPVTLNTSFGNPTPSRKRPFPSPTTITNSSAFEIRSDPKDQQFGPRRHKSRKLGEDTVTSSPVSGMFIKEESDVKPVEELQKEADSLDETAAYVEVTEESRQKIDDIPNIIGDCVCRLCKVKYDDVFKLAQHKCPRIAHEEYKCPDCEKVFSCPANLASHRRWHKPKGDHPLHNHQQFGGAYSCTNCFASFGSKKLMRAHIATCQHVRSPLQSLLARVIPTI